MDLEKQENPAHRESTLHRVSFAVVFLLLLFGPYAWYMIRVAIERGKPYYTAEITSIKASNFTEAEVYHTSPSFYITMRVQNQDTSCNIYFKDWQFSIFHDGIPLGHGFSPDGFVVNKTSDVAGITGTTSTPLLGLAKEVHDHIISSGQSF
uniref:Late embryogenesis abundant protein LEA-2 subgroup domain-containing protein n=1 Tax=Leersia perrieri TaxID=77586 RepID=A0A0D9V3H4_9ORYZ